MGIAHTNSDYELVDYQNEYDSDTVKTNDNYIWWYSIPANDKVGIEPYNIDIEVSAGDMLFFEMGSITATAATMAFATLGFAQIFHCFNCKFEGTVISREIFSNKFMDMSVGITWFIMLYLICTPAGLLFGLSILSFPQLLVCLGLAFAIVPFAELLKYLLKKLKF